MARTMAVRPFVVALIAWTAVVIAVLFFYPAAGPGVLGCMRLIGVGRTLACETQQAAINEIWWVHQTLPMLMAMVAGYLGILALPFASLRRARARA